MEARNHYPTPLHLQNASSPLGYRSGVFPVAEFQASRLITLPVRQFFEDQHLAFPRGEICEFYGKR